MSANFHYLTCPLLSVLIHVLLSLHSCTRSHLLSLSLSNCFWNYTSCLIITFSHSLLAYYYHNTDMLYNITITIQTCYNIKSHSSLDSIYCSNYHSTLVLFINTPLGRTVQTCKLHFPHRLKPVPVRLALLKTTSLSNLMINPFLLNSLQYLTRVITPSYMKQCLHVTSGMPQPLKSFLHNSLFC